MELKKYFSYTNAGPFHEVNEDAVGVDLKSKIYYLLDGFGGQGVGDRACELVIENFLRFYTKTSRDPDSTMPFFYSPKYLLEGNALVNALRLAHKELIEKNQKKEMGQRGGVAGIFAVESENILSYAYVGNCQAYLYRRGNLRPLNLPDVLSNVAQDDFNSHLYSAPMSAFGLFDELHLQVSEVKIMDEDCLIFLSDGVYSYLSPEEIIHVLGDKSKNYQELGKQLITLANSRGNQDNQSLLILEY